MNKKTENEFKDNANIVSQGNETELKQQAQEARERLEQEGLLGHMSHKDKQPISWIKMGDIHENTLYLSKKVLAIRRFHDENKIVDWENSEIRAWLNIYLIKEIFTEAERSLLQTKMSKSFLGLIQRKSKELDRIFLLSTNDIENVKNVEDLETSDIESVLLPTTPLLPPVYGAMTASRKLSHNAWWLSSTAKLPERAMTVFYNGTVNKQGYHKHHAHCGVRPAVLVPRYKDKQK